VRLLKAPRYGLILEPGERAGNRRTTRPDPRADREDDLGHNGE
jgi:hypothetical protein